MGPGSGMIHDDLGLSGGPAPGDAPPAYHRRMAFDLVRTTYGAAALDALAAAVARAKGDEPLRPVTVVVPSNYAGVAARRALARRHGVIGVAFVTLYRLAELLAGPTLARSGRVPVSSPVVATAFRAALAEDPGLFGPVVDQPSTVEALRRVHRELRDLDDLQRHRLAQSDARAAAVVAIDERVTQRLEARWHDETDLMLTAAALARSGDAAAELGPLVVHLPQEVSSSAARLLQAVAAHAPVTVIVGVTGRADARGTAVARAARPRRGATLTAGSRRHDDGADDRRALGRARGRSRRGRRGPHGPAPCRRGGRGRDRVGADRHRPRLPRAPYGRLLTEHLTAARLPWNGITASSVAERVAGRTLLGLLDLDTAAFRRRDVFALLASVPPVASPAGGGVGTAGPPSAGGGRATAVGRAAGGAGGGRAAPGRRRRRRARHGGTRRPSGPTSCAPSSRPWPSGSSHRGSRRGPRTLGGPAACWSSSSAARRSRRGGVPRSSAPRERVERVLERLARLDGVADDVEGHGVDRAVFRVAARRRAGRWPGHGRAAGRGDLRRPDPAGRRDRRRPRHRPRPGRGRPARGLGDDPLLSDRTRRTLDGALTTAAERRERLHHQLLAVAGAAQRTVVASRPLADLRTGSARYASRWLSGLERSAPARTGPPPSFHQGLHDGLPPGHRAGGRPDRPAADRAPPGTRSTRTRWPHGDHALHRARP